jgi:hypothetical protein
MTDLQVTLITGAFFLLCVTYICGLDRLRR